MSIPAGEMMSQKKFTAVWPQPFEDPWSSVKTSVTEFALCLGNPDFILSDWISYFLWHTLNILVRSEKWWSMIWKFSVCDKIWALNSDLIWDGFSSTSSLGGGTGSGYATMVFMYLADVCPKIPKICHQFLCSSQIQSNLCEPYNNIFAITDQRKTVDIIFSYDNQTL